ncbi:hypothetical protein [Jannaschia donghaensis]|uniref:hypothetical protein n=1 Tax=Jannaschia donghaensis TaxID=420998 RepID=UPI0011876E40|nr:hypothetical protein [Jannaschia donghaensis]
MSKGSYSGGHTIIRADGSFGSIDPAETRYEPKRAQKNKAKKPKKAVKPSKPLPLAAQRKMLLNIAADARASNRKQGLKFPKNICDEVQQDVARVGTIEAWASKQAGFNDLVKTKVDKKQAKAKRKSNTAGPVQVEVVAKRQRAIQKPKPDNNRIAFLKGEIAQAREFISLAEKEIKHLESGSS